MGERFARTELFEGRRVRLRAAQSRHNQHNRRRKVRTGKPAAGEDSESRRRERKRYPRCVEDSMKAIDRLKRQPKPAAKLLGSPAVLHELLKARSSASGDETRQKRDTGLGFG